VEVNSSITILMASFKFISLLSLALATLGSAHFVVNSPPPLGNNIDNEGEAPCGGFTPGSSDKLTDFHVGGDVVSLTTLHAQAYFDYKGLLGSSLSAANWTALIPTVIEYGLNSFCEPKLAVPASWAGSSGLLQIIQDAEDGIHYQVRPLKSPLPKILACSLQMDFDLAFIYLSVCM
jgi:hypothetical protein